MSLLEAAHAAAQHWTSDERATPVVVWANPTVPGLAGAGILAQTLGRLGRTFHIRFAPSFALESQVDVAPEPNEVRLLLDWGGSIPDRAARWPGSTLILDLRPSGFQPPGLTTLDTANATAATAAFALAVALDERAWDTAPLALAAQAHGATLADAKGWNGTVLAEAERRRLVTTATGLALPDVALVDLLAAPRPPLRGLFPPGYESAHALLSDHGLPAEATVHELSAPHRQALASLIGLAHLRAGRPPQDLARCFAPIPTRTGPDPSPLPRIASLLDAAVRGGEPGLGLGLCVGDASARPELEALEVQVRRRARQVLERLAAAPPPAAEGLRVVRLPEAHDGLHLVPWLADVHPGSEPWVGWAESDQGDVIVGAPGNQLHAAFEAASRELGGATRRAAEAATATVPRGMHAAFLHSLGTAIRGPEATT